MKQAVKKKIFLDGIARYKDGRYKGKIDWNKSIGYKVKFVYDDIEGEIEIVDYNIKTQYLYVKYLDKDIFKISKCNLQNCCLGELVGKKTILYKFEIGDIVNTKNGKLKLLEQIRVPQGNNGRTEKGYRYQCLKCGNIDVIQETKLNTQGGCNVCCGHSKVLKGYNDLWTTNPNVAKMLKYPEIGHTISSKSHTKQKFVCKNCGYEKSVRVADVTVQGFSCPRCGDNISYSEKIMFNALEQSNVEFITQLNKTTFDWCKNYKYDFYVPLINCIIEIHGLQHYEDSFQKIKSNKKIRSLEEEQENDKIKEKLALENGIKKENYIIIDARYSELEYIKNNILNSKLGELLDLNKIDWLQCEKYALNNLVKKACTLWEQGNTIMSIGKMLNLSNEVIRKYLKKGNELKWCEYIPQIKPTRPVICVNTKINYSSASEASRILNISRTHIGDCCRGKMKSSGKHPITGESLKWMYYEDYLKLHN